MSSANVPACTIASLTKTFLQVLAARLLTTWRQAFKIKPDAEENLEDCDNSTNEEKSSDKFGSTDVVVAHAHCLREEEGDGEGGNEH